MKNTRKFVSTVPFMNSISQTGISLLFVSGLHNGWGVWRMEIQEPWVSFTNLNIIIFIIMSWYVFAVIGGIIGAVLVTNMRKKLIYVS